MLNSGTAWKTIPYEGTNGSAPLIKHPTTAWPPSQGSRAVLTPEEIEPAPSTSFRRVARPQRQSPTVPWFFIITCMTALTVLILLVVKQRAELVKEQYALVDLKTQRAKVLKQRNELKLSIQGLTALERIDGMVRTKLKMIRPPHRIVLDLSQYRLGTSSADASTALASRSTVQGAAP